MNLSVYKLKSNFVFTANEDFNLRVSQLFYVQRHIRLVQTMDNTSPNALAYWQPTAAVRLN